MANNRFETKAQRKIKHLNAIVFLSVSAVLLVCAFLYISAVIRAMAEEQSLRQIPGFTGIATMLFVIVVELFLFLFLPAAAAFFGFQNGRRKAYRHNASFSSNSDITYYRDMLKGVSPATMSIVMDLDIENNKDIAATLLRLYNKRIICFEDGRIIRGDGTAEPDNSERELLALLSSDHITEQDVSRWRSNRFKEAMADGYVEKAQKYKQSGLGCCLGSLLALGCLIGAFVMLGAGIEDVATRLDGFQTIDSDSAALVSGILLRAAGGFALIDIAIALPCYSLFHWIAYLTIRKYKLVRTAKGNELAGKAAGLKRFIHEFSALSERSAEEVFLWDDYLVYAVVLEENEAIITELLKRRIGNVNLKGVMGRFPSVRDNEYGGFFGDLETYYADLLKTPTIPLIIYGLILLAAPLAFAVNMSAEQDVNWIMPIVLCLPGFGVLMNGLRTRLKQQRKYRVFMETANRIKRNGTKVQGEVVKIVYNAESKYAVVRFDLEGRSITFETPEITFRKLRSNDVTVYVYGKKYFADEFDGARVI